MPDYAWLKSYDTANTAALTPEAAAAAINALTRTETFSRFLSLRSLAAVLSDAEYTAFKAFTATAAQTSARTADMVALLETPSNDEGDNGGLDFGEADVLAMMDAFAAIEGMADAAARVKALVTRTVNVASDYGFTPVWPAQIRRVRSMA